MRFEYGICRGVHSMEAVILNAGLGREVLAVTAEIEPSPSYYTLFCAMAMRGRRVYV